MSFILSSVLALFPQGENTFGYLTFLKRNPSAPSLPQPTHGIWFTFTAKNISTLTASSRTDSVSKFPGLFIPILSWRSDFLYLLIPHRQLPGGHLWLDSWRVCQNLNEFRTWILIPSCYPLCPAPINLHLTSPFQSWSAQVSLPLPSPSHAALVTQHQWLSSTNSNHPNQLLPVDFHWHFHSLAVYGLLFELLTMVSYWFSPLFLPITFRTVLYTVARFILLRHSDVVPCSRNFNNFFKFRNNQGQILWQEIYNLTWFYLSYFSAMVLLF